MPINPTSDDIGRTVIYRPYKGATPEQGIITSFTPAFVFVRYGAAAHSQPTDSADLEWVNASD